MTDFACPNTPRCEHPSLVHDIEDYDDPRPMCCVEGCSCGKSVPAVTRDDLVDLGVKALGRDLGIWMATPYDEYGMVVGVVINALIAAGHLRPTEGSDT